MKNILRFPLLSLAGLVLTGTNANAAIVFRDNFEPGVNSNATSLQGAGTTADVSTYTLANTSRSANTTLWVRATEGFGASQNGLIDESENSGNNFTDPTGTQAYGFRYTNSGLTSAHNTIGSLTAGTIISVSFDVCVDGFNAGNAYEVGLVLFDGASTRNVQNGGFELNTAAVLKKASGTTSATNPWQTINFSYTVGDPLVDNNGAGSGASTAWLPSLLGLDIAFRIKGATTYANIDNVLIDISPIPEPTTALAGLLLGLGLLRRRR